MQYNYKNNIDKIDYWFLYLNPNIFIDEYVSEEIMMKKFT